MPRTKKEPVLSQPVVQELREDEIEFKRNPIESAMHSLRGYDESTVRDFFTAWSIPFSVVAERLRISGYPVTAKHIEAILKAPTMDREGEYLLSIAMMEMRNDIIKIIYK